MSKGKLPRFPFKLLSWFCPEYLYEEIEGDLIQKFARDARSYGEGRAKRKLFWNVIRFFRPGILLRHKPTLHMPVNMIENYFKVAFRVIQKNRTFSTINILGLTLGITGALLLFMWVNDEFTYDQFHTDKKIYKVWNRAKIDGDVSCWDMTPRVLASTLKGEYSAIESSVSYARYGGEYLFTAGNVKLVSTATVFTDPEFLTMFTFPLVKGDVRSALDNPSSIVITEKFAKQLFGDREAFGESITLQESGYSFPFTVTGVLKDLPSNTDFHFDYLVSFKFLEDLEGKGNDWSNNSVGTFISLRDGADAGSIDRQIMDVAKKHSANKDAAELFIYPLTKMHLFSRFENGVPVGGKIEIMRMIGILGVVLILIACINYINLSTARAQKRAKEVGIRKVTGARQYSLVLQFICESVLIAVVAGVISIVLVYVSLPAFNSLISKQLALSAGGISFWSTVAAVIVGVGILAGAYPAFYLSAFKPVRVLKGLPVTIGSRNILRKGLVVFQFGFALTLIFSTIVIYRQITHVQHREAGYSKDNLIYHPINGDLQKNFVAYKNELLQSGVAVSVTKTSSPITEAWANTYSLEWEGKQPDQKIYFDRFYIDENFTSTAGVTLVAGRDMDLEKYPSDSTALLINEAAAKVMGFKNPLGEIVKDGNTEWHIVGVLKDFVLTSPTQRVQPIVFEGAKGWFTTVHIKLNDKRPMTENIAVVNALFTKYNSVFPFDYHFVDQAYEQKFEGISKTLMLTTIFSFIAIFIACLGLLGLSTFMIESRVKEIGIRKVMGASSLNITKLLCSSYVKPITLGIILHAPLAWLSMNWYLESFEYRISLDVWLLLTAAVAILSIALMTVGVQTLRAAKADPVNSLRVE